MKTSSPKCRASSSSMCVGYRWMVGRYFATGPYPRGLVRYTLNDRNAAGVEASIADSLQLIYIVMRCIPLLSSRTSPFPSHPRVPVSNYGGTWGQRRLHSSRSKHKKAASSSNVGPAYRSLGRRVRDPLPRSIERCSRS